MLVHPSTLVDDGHLAALADRARDSVAATLRPDGDTIALVTADAEGNAVSLIQSLFWGFGSGILEPETGIAAQNRGACFTLESGHPNRFAPGARPFHTLMPVLVHRAGELAGVAGTMGGYPQPQINLHTITKTFVAGAHPGDAVAAPRWVVLGPMRAARRRRSAWKRVFPIPRWQRCGSRRIRADRGGRLRARPPDPPNPGGVRGRL